MKRLITFCSSLSPENGSGMTRDYIGIDSARSRKLFALLFCLLFVGVGNVWGDSYTITFSNNANGATPISSSVNASTTIANDGSRSYVTTQPYTVNSGNCYYGGDGKNNIRLASSGSNAELEIALSSAGQVAATTIVVNCMKMSGNKNTSATLSVNGASAQSAPASANNLTFTINDDITAITLTSVKAVFIYSITVNYSAGCTNGTITYSPGSTTYTGGNAISGSHANDTKVCSSNLTLPGETFTTTGYTQDGWATSDGGSKAYNLSATNYATEGNATLYPHWAANNYTVTWMSNGIQHTTTQVAYGSKPTFPSTPVSCDGTSTTFIGWTQTPWSGKIDDISGLTTDATKVYTEASQMPNVTADVTYHAVFAKGTTTSTPVANTWNRITSTSQLTDGATVLLIQYYYDRALNTSLGNSSVTANAEITNSTANLRWTIVKSGTKWKFKNSSNQYLSTSSLDNQTTLSLSSTYDEWSISTDAGDYSNCFNLNNGNDLECYRSGKSGSYTYTFKLYEWSESFSQCYPFYIYIQKTTESTTYDKYLTNCCTALGTINGSVSWTNPTKAVLLWDADTHASSYAVTYRTGSAAYGNTNVSAVRDTLTNKKTCVITGLSCNTSYDFKIAITAASNYCDKDSVMENKNSGYWDVTYSVNNASRSSGQTAGTDVLCGDLDVVFGASQGYVLPNSVTVTGASSHTWTQATGTLHVDEANITGDITVNFTATAAACSDQYTFAYGATADGDHDISNPTKLCFSQVDATTEYQITGFTIPNTEQYYWVGYNGYYYGSNIGPGGASNAGSERNQFKYMPVANLQGSSCGGEGIYYKHTAAGAYGTLRIYSDNSGKNLYLGFVPAGYQMRIGSGESWSNIQLTQSGSVWTSSILTLDAATVAKNYYINVWTGSSYSSGDAGVAINNWTDGGSTISSMAFKKNAGDAAASWDTSTGLSAGMRGFFRTWTDNCANNGYAHFVPVHRIIYNANWPVSGAPADTYSVDVSVEETNSSIELASAPSAPTGYHFVGWYDAAEGGNEVTGTQTISAGTSADVELYAHWSNQTTITLSKGTQGAANGIAVGTYGSNTVGSFTAVTYSGTSYRLLGYSKSGTPAEIVIDKDGHFVANTTYTDASGNWKSTAAEVTLVAQWKAGHTITWSANGTTYETSFVDSDGTIALPAGTPTSCDASDTHTYTTFIGWYTEAAGTNSAPTTDISDCGTKINGGEACPGTDKTYYAVWGNGALVGGETKELTLDFTSNTTWQFPTDYVTSSSEASFTNTYTVKVAGDDENGYKWNSSTNSLIVGKEGAYLKLPAFSFATSKLVVTGPATGASGKVTWNVFVGSDAVSTEVTGANGENTFNIASANQAAGNVYLFKVTNGNNTQFKTIEVYSQAAGATGFISSCCASTAVINVTPTSDNLALDIDGNASTTVNFSKSGTSNTVWLMEPTIDPAVGASLSGWAGTYKTAAYDLTFNATATGTYTIKEEGQDKGTSCSKYGTATITVAANPILTASVANLTVNGVCDDNGTPQTFTLNSRYLPNAQKTLTITAATTSGSGAYKVSTDGSSYSTSVNVTGGVDSKATQTIYVRYEGAADETGSLEGSVTISNNNGVSTSVALSGTCSCDTYVKLTPANATSTHILAPNGQWTRAQGAIAIRANYLSSAAANTIIVLTSSNSNFKFTETTTSGTVDFKSEKIVTASNNSWDGTVYIVYTPTTYNASESTTIKAQVHTFGGTYDDAHAHASTTTTVYGRSFPETFVLAVNTGSSWVAVPADMIAPYGGSGNQCTTGVGTHDPYPITVNNNANPTSASNVPARAIYKGASRNTPTSAPWTVQMESNSQTGYYLWGSKNANTIANQNYVTGERQKWFAESSDLVTFNFHLDDSIRAAGARLGYSGSAIGQYVSAASSYKYDFRILPISGDPCTYVINPVMTLSAYDGTNATVSIPYDGTTNYEISKNAKSTWTDIVGAIDCKTLNFTLPLATYKGEDVWLRADGTICQGDATSESALHIPAPVITDPGAQHLYGVINVATSESFAVTGTDMYGTISVTSSNPAITASYSAGSVTVEMASTAVAGDYTTTLTLSTVGGADVTVDVTITIRDLAEMTFRIDDLSGGKICHNSLEYTDKFYVYLNNGSAVYRANDGSSLVDATYKVGSAVFIRDLSTNGDDWNTGFNNYSVASGIAQFSIPTTSLVSGHTYRISYYNSLANEGVGFFDSNGLGFADAHVDFVYSLDCTAPTAMMPCITSPKSIVAHWDDFTCEAPNTLQLNLFKHNDTELVNADFPTTTIKVYDKAGASEWGCGKTGVAQNGSLASASASGYTFYTSATSNAFASPKLSTIDASTELQVTFTTKNFASANRTVQIYVVAGNNWPTTANQKTIYIDDVRTSNKTFSTTSNQLETWNVKLSGLAANDRIVFAASTAAGSYGLKSVTISTVAREYVTGYDHKNVAGTSQEVTGLTANTTYYTTMNCGSKESPEVAFHTWTSGSSYVKFYEDAGHTTEIEALDKIVVLGGQTTHVYMVGQKVPGCEVIPTVSSGYGLEDHTTYDPATGALGGYIDLTLTNPSTTSGTLTITDGTGTTYTRPIKSSDCPTDFETLALAASAITKNSATANWNSSADFEGVTEGTLYLYRDGVVDAEYITNEGFETGDLTGWNYFNPGAVCACGAYEVRNSNAHSGTHALYVSEEGSIWSGIKYATVIYGNPVTLPAGTYEMSSWVKVPKVGEFSDKHVSLVQGLVSTGVISRTHAAVYAISEEYFDVVSNNTYVKITDEFVIESPIQALPIIGQRDDYGITFRPFYLDDVSLKRISAPNAEEPDKVFPIADMSAASSQDLGTLSGNTQYTYMLKNENGCPSNTITFKTLPADGPTISAEDIEISAPAGSSATGVIVVQVWDATAEISVSKGVASGSDQITLSNVTVPQEGGTIRVLFTPNTDPGSTGTCPVTLNTRGLAEPVIVNIHWTVTAGEDTNKPIVEVTEVSNEWIKIEHNVDADNVTIILNREKTADEIETNVGDEIFFSKYYEAYSHKKLWAIYNPTSDTISLAGMEVWRSSSKYDGWHSDVMDLSEMGYIKPGWICPNEEIVVYTTNQVGTCEQNTVGLDVMSTWWQGGTSSDMPLSFSGDDALLLVRNTSAVLPARHNALPTTSVKTGEAISWPDPISNARGDWYMLDIIGGRTDGGSPSGKNVQTAWHWYNSKTGEDEDGDDRGWVGYGKDMSGAADYNTSSEHPGYLLSTNRCLLVRLKHVSSGANAVNSNIDNMVTLNTEWQGSHVPTEGDQAAVSCNNFSYVGGYDYGGYYNAWTEMGDYEVDGEPNSDGSYTAEFKVNEFYCKTVHIEVSSTEIINGVETQNVHAYEDYKVPIVVDADKQTTADLFEFGGDTCATCDVVIRDEATLSHVSGGVDQFRNMTVYPGASFDNSAKQGFLLDGLLMEAKNDDVGYAIINNNGSTIAAGKVVHVKRIDDQYWYPFSLPYDCDVAAIRQQNGKSMGEYWEDWGIKYYDGAARQAEGESASPGASSKYWKQLPVSSTLKANEAYIIGLFTTEWDGQFKSVYFPPKTTKEYTEAGDDAKTTDVYNWAEGLANEKRHHGWNFVGSPYISLFGSSMEGHGMNNSTNLILGKIEEDGSYSDLGSVYVSIPDGGSSKTYTQAKASATKIKPFQGYFVQTVDPTNGIDNTLNLTYQKTDRTLTPDPARKATAEKLRVEVDLVVNGEGMSDIAGVVVDDCYKPEYEIGGDLTKMYAAAKKPQLYFLDASNEKMAYIALPDANAENVVMELYAPKAGQYTISLNAGSSRTKGAESVELLYEGNAVANLLIEDYTIEAAKGTVSGYSVRIRRAAQVATSVDMLNGEHITVISNNGQISVVNVPGDAKVMLFDMTGRLLGVGSAEGGNVVNMDAPQQGVYSVVLQSASGHVSVKTILR